LLVVFLLLKAVYTTLREIERLFGCKIVRLRVGIETYTGLEKR